MRHVLGAARLTGGEIRFFSFCVTVSCPHRRLYADASEALAFADRDCAFEQIRQTVPADPDAGQVEMAVAVDGGRTWSGTATRAALDESSPWRPQAELRRGLPAWGSRALIRAGAAEPTVPA